MLNNTKDNSSLQKSNTSETGSQNTETLSSLDGVEKDIPPKLTQASIESKSTNKRHSHQNVIAEFRKKIEDEYDLQQYYKSKEDFEKNPITYSHKEVAEILELDKN